MNPSWDDGSASMTSIDLLSTTTSLDQGDIRPSQSNLEQISEENTGIMMLSAEAVPATGLFKTPSLIASSSSEPQPSPLNNHQGSSPAPTAADPSAIYQIDFDVEHLGKNKPQSKRMAIWKYGVECNTPRGIKIAGHEAKLTWSTHSGKYTISVDGEEVFSSIAKGSVLEHKWKYSHSKGTCVTDSSDDGDGDGDAVAMRIIACRKPPVRSSKNFRCYEFIIGGRVFRDLEVHPEVGHNNNGREFQNEESLYNNDGKLMSILDVIEPGWRAAGFA